MKKKILLTGIAGFIGFSLARRLMEEGGCEIVGIDNMNDYYDTSLKYDRLAQLGLNRESVLTNGQAESNRYPGLHFLKLDLENQAGMMELFAANKFDLVVHLAAQAGVRHSLHNPHLYVQSNVSGFLNVLEGCKVQGVQHLIYASSSSVYGLDSSVPFSESAPVNKPVSMYAATKKMNEMMAYTYSHLYSIPVTGLRFFTVYGPWGRPDMSPMLFATAIRDGKPIKVFNYGNMRRDFTYIDDIVDGISRVMQSEPAKYRLYNIGNSKPVDLMAFIELMEKGMGRTAIIETLPMQPGEVYETYADTSLLMADTGYRPSTTLEMGIPSFLEWFTTYYGPNSQKAG